MRKTFRNHFTLIELMVIIAIIGIVAMMSILYYRDYLIRAKAIEDLNLARTVKLNVKKVIIAKKNSKNLYPAETKYILKSSSKINVVQNIEILNHNVIIITHGDNNANTNYKTLKLIPRITDLNKII